MQFAPKSENELNPTLPDGEHTATVVKAEEKVSRGGNDMIALTLRAEMPGGGSALIKDWLLPNDKGMWKVHDFCKAAGLMERYDAGDLRADDCLEAEVRIKVKNEASEEFGEQARVKGYIKPDPDSAPMPEPVGTPAAQGQRARKADAEKAAEQDDSDIPF